MAKTSVLHVLSTSRYSGAENIAGQICRRLDRGEFDVRILCNGGPLLRRYRDDGLEAIDLNVNLCLPWNMASFAGIVRRHGVHIVHAHGTRASAFALLSRPLAGGRYLIVSHLHGCRRWQRGRNVLSAVDRFLAGRYDMNIVCGALVYDHLMGGGRGPDPSKVRIVSNALELECAAAADASPACAEGAPRGGTPGDSRGRGEFVFGFVGRFSKPKGLVPFLEKVIENRDVLDGARLILVGDGEDMGAVRKMAAASGLSGAIELRGYREDAPALMRGFDVLVLPSISEGLPMVILEAMSIAKPVLAFDVGSVSEALRDGVNGRLVKAGDYGAFIRRMREMKASGADLAEMGARGRALLASEFGIDRYMREIEDLYRSLRGAEERSC
jgi:glycosyltransferase involved in cell wall biosynthesis